MKVVFICLDISGQVDFPSRNNPLNSANRLPWQMSANLPDEMAKIS